MYQLVSLLLSLPLSNSLYFYECPSVRFIHPVFTFSCMYFCVFLCFSFLVIRFVYVSVGLCVPVFPCPRACEFFCPCVCFLPLLFMPVYRVCSTFFFYFADSLCSCLCLLFLLYLFVLPVVVFFRLYMWICVSVSVVCVFLCTFSSSFYFSPFLPPFFIHGYRSLSLCRLGNSFFPALRLLYSFSKHSVNLSCLLSFCIHRYYSLSVSVVYIFRVSLHSVCYIPSVNIFRSSFLPPFLPLSIHWPVGD